MSKIIIIIIIPYKRIEKSVEHESDDCTNKGLFKGLEDLEVGGRVETIQMTALLRTARIMMLYIDLRPGQTCHSKDGGSAYSIAMGELGGQNGTR